MPDKFTLVKKGYDTAEVDKYIENLELVIKGYKEKDAAINNALISAQITAGNIVKEAEENARKIKEAVIEKLNNVSESVVVQKRIIKEFHTDYNSLIDKYVHKVNENEILELYTKINELEDYMTSLTAE